MYMAHNDVLNEKSQGIHNQNNRLKFLMIKSIVM